MSLTVYMGWDAREEVAYKVCEYSVHRRAKSKPVKVVPLKHKDLRKQGFFHRPWLTQSTTGDWLDLLDNKPFSTEFSHTRFLVPALNKFKGWAVFMDCDMVITKDINKLLELCDDSKALMVVKHNYKPKETTKMDGCPQQLYPRKNWSSFILFNCAHPANAKLTIERVNSEPGSWLHNFNWLPDHLIGSLPPEWNWLEGHSAITQELPANIHFTRGGPWFPEYGDVIYADIWTKEYEHWQKFGDHDGVSPVPSLKYGG